MSKESSEAGRPLGAGNRFVPASSGEARGSGIEGRRDAERPDVEADPCANGCSNPAAHAEGAHDV